MSSDIPSAFTSTMEHFGPPGKVVFQRAAARNRVGVAVGYNN